MVLLSFYGEFDCLSFGCVVFWLFWGLIEFEGFRLFRLNLGSKSDFGCVWGFLVIFGFCFFFDSLNEIFNGFVLNFDFFEVNKEGIYMLSICFVFFLESILGFIKSLIFWGGLVFFLVWDCCGWLFLEDDSGKGVV